MFGCNEQYVTILEDIKSCYNILLIEIVFVTANHTLEWNSEC